MVSAVSSPVIPRRLGQFALVGGPSTAAPAGYPADFLDRSVRPQDNFYQFATGGYAKSHPIPDDRSTWGPYPAIAVRVQGDLVDILGAAAAQKGAAPGSPDQLIGDFYGSAMDQKGIDAAGYKPLQPELDRIDRLKTPLDLQDEMAHLVREGRSMVIGFGATPDPKNPDVNMAGAYGGGLGLPSKDYYTDPSQQGVRDGYAAYMKTVFGLLGETPQQAEDHAAAVMRIETRLAQGSMSPAEERDPEGSYNPTDRAGLAVMTPDFDWSRFLQGVGRPDVTTVNVGSPAFFKNLNPMLTQVPMDDWKAYMRFHLINQNASYLSQPIADANFKFQGGVLNGVTHQTSRDKRMASLTDSVLSDALGQKYVAAHFSPEAKAKALDMINNIKAVLRDKIDHSAWMSAPTRQQALQKVDQMRVKVGYPDKWESYSGLSIDRGPLVSNMARIKAWGAARDLASIGQPVDRGAWVMTPCTVNACYNPTTNDITFPAARLQPPFFDPNQDDALNYGATGVTMGHEMSHGFDDQGAHFDARGALKDWWQPADKVTFKKLADGVEHQFDGYSFDGVKVTGRLVEGESLADLGGVELATEAFRRSQAAHGPTPQPNDGFTPDQRVYLGYALCRENQARPEAAKLQITSDPHPLGIFRVNGPFSNFPGFYQAYDVKPGDPMRRADADRNHLWNP